jgi:hypothetical protein
MIGGICKCRRSGEKESKNKERSHSTHNSAMKAKVSAPLYEKNANEPVHTER